MEPTPCDVKTDHVKNELIPFVRLTRLPDQLTTAVTTKTEPEEFPVKEETVKNESEEEELKPTLTVFLTDRNSEDNQQVFPVKEETVKHEGEEEELKPTLTVFLTDRNSEDEPQEFPVKEETVKHESKEEELKPALTVFLTDGNSEDIPQEFPVKEEIVKNESEEEELKPTLTVFLTDISEGEPQEPSDQKRVFKSENAIKEEPDPEFKHSHLLDVKTKIKKEFPVKEEIIKHESEEKELKPTLTVFLTDRNSEDEPQVSENETVTEDHKEPTVIGKTEYFSGLKDQNVLTQQRHQQLSDTQIYYQPVNLLKCQTCGKSFSHKCSLRRHMAVHTGFKPFTCGTCEKTFAQKSYLKSHIQTHTGVKPFTCGTCGKTFNQKCNLKSYTLTHTGSKLFTCKTCSKSCYCNNRILNSP